jgi:glucosamine--fructose-6-phosphate aminotransferase (isomerizing)
LAQPAFGTIDLRKTEANVRSNLSILQGRYLQDVLDQPGALNRTLENLHVSAELNTLITKIHGNDFLRIVLTGMGSSFYALHPLTLDLIQQGYTAMMLETSELVHCQSSLFDSKTLIIAVSQSGRSAETVRLLEVNERRAAVLGITNTADRLLARQADAAVLTSAGEEFSVSCKTYVSTLLALKWIGDVFANRDLEVAKAGARNAASAVQSYLDCWEDHVDKLTQDLKDVQRLFFVGRGASLAAAGTGALIVKESDHFHAEGMSSAALRHGPFEILNHQTLVVVFAGNSTTANLNRRLAQDIREHRAIAELVSENAANSPFRLPSAPEAMLSILEIIPAQMITLALAVLAGREPGRFERVSKVTTTE